MTYPMTRCVGIPDRKVDPAKRLAWARDLAHQHGPCTIQVHPATAAETTAPEGVTLVPVPQKQRYDYCFITKEAK